MTFASTHVEGDRCRRCGYDLRGAGAGEARCAECGFSATVSREVRTFPGLTAGMLRQVRFAIGLAIMALAWPTIARLMMHAVMGMTVKRARAAVEETALRAAFALYGYVNSVTIALFASALLVLSLVLARARRGVAQAGGVGGVCLAPLLILYAYFDAHETLYAFPFTPSAHAVLGVVSGLVWLILGLIAWRQAPRRLKIVLLVIAPFAVTHAIGWAHRDWGWIWGVTGVGMQGFIARLELLDRIWKWHQLLGGLVMVALWWVAAESRRTRRLLMDVAGRGEKVDRARPGGDCPRAHPGENHNGPSRF